MSLQAEKEADSPDELATNTSHSSTDTRSTDSLAQPRQVICILGMHRSGTSCLTGSLQEAGLFLGKFSEWNRFNTKGNRENQDIVELHGEVLASNNCSWDDPSGNCVWSDEQTAQLRVILSSYGEQERFGFKDPRTLLTLSGWRRVVNNLQFVGIFRHPEAVARSLKRRSRIPRGKAIDLWYEYNLRLLRQYLRKPFPVLCFDDSGDDLTRKIQDVAVRLGLQSTGDGNGFYNRKLRHYQSEDMSRLPRKVRLLYRVLRWISV